MLAAIARLVTAQPRRVLRRRPEDERGHGEQHHHRRPGTMTEFARPGDHLLAAHHLRPHDVTIACNLIATLVDCERQAEAYSVTTPELMRAVREYADSIHPYRDGRSSERVLQAIDAFLAAGVLAGLGSLIALVVLPSAQTFLPQLRLAPAPMGIH